MRTALALLVLLPMLAGCARPGTELVEAFHATYAIGDGLQVSATFGDVVDYVDRAGEVRQGYLLHVQYSAPGERLGYDQTVYDGDLRPVRTVTCNDWIGGDCVRRGYSWAGPGRPLDLPGGFRLNLEGHDDATKGSDGEDDKHAAALAFDDHLAPTAFLWDGHDVATRTSYESRGALPPLAPQAPPQVPVQAPGVALPGSDQLLPGIPYTLDDVLAFLQSEDPQAHAMLTSGGCLGRLILQREDDPGPAAITMDKDEGRIVIGLTNATKAQAFAVVYGRRAPFDEPALLRTSFAATAQPRFDCQSRPDVMAIQDVVALADRLLADHTPLDLRWARVEGSEDARLEWRFEEDFHTPRASILLDATSGLVWWWSPVGSIDP